MKVLAFIGGNMPDAKTRVNSSRWKATVRGRKGVFYQSVAVGKGKGQPFQQVQVLPD
jgi:hypothetical protein